MANLLREIHLHGLPRSFTERLAGVLVGSTALASADPSAPETHIALAGLFALARPTIDEIDRVWSKTESPAHARWERDRLILSLSTSVREKRIARAWDRLAAQGPIDDSTGG